MLLHEHMLFQTSLFVLVEADEVEVKVFYSILIQQVRLFQQTAQIQVVVAKSIPTFVGLCKSQVCQS